MAWILCLILGHRSEILRLHSTRQTMRFCSRCKEVFSLANEEDTYRRNHGR